MTTSKIANSHGIRDNHSRGKVANESKQVKHASDFDLITWLVIKQLD